jgi:hypothetical protein
MRWVSHEATQHEEQWSIDRLVVYTRDPRKNDATVNRMCGSIREFGSKSRCCLVRMARSLMVTLRLKAARKLGTSPSASA